MTEREAFIEAIAANPHEDTPRLAFADWLQEHGEEDRAAFLRLSYELLDRQRGLDDPLGLPDDLRALQNRAQELFESRGAVWLEPFCLALGVGAVAPVRRERWSARLWRRVRGKPGQMDRAFRHFRFGYVRIDGWGDGPLRALDLRHGLADRLEISFKSSPVRDLAAAFRLEPVQSLTIRVAENPDRWRRLDSPCLARVESLTVEVPNDSDRRIVGTFEGLCQGENWSALGDFSLWGDVLQPVPHEYFALLARSPFLSGLRSLSVLTDLPDLRPLTTNARLADLQTFGVWGSRLPLDAGDVIAGAVFRPKLEELDLSGTHLGDAGAWHVASAAWPKLYSLNCGFNDLSDAGARSLLSLVPQLSDLDLAGNAITDAGARELADAIDPEKLKSLCLSYNPLSPETVAALRARFGKRFSFTTPAEDAARRDLFP